MLATALSALALAVGSVHGYVNSSPLFLYSTSNLNISPIDHISQASSIQNVLSKALSQCPTTNYLIVHLSGVYPEEYTCPKNTPFLRNRLNAPGAGHTGLMVRDVLGTIDVEDILKTITKSCNKQVQILNTPDDLTFPVMDEAQRSSKVFYASLGAFHTDITPEDRKLLLQLYDNFISSLVENYFDGKNYTLIYATESSHVAMMKDSGQQDFYDDFPLTDFMHGGELVRRNLAGRDGELTTNQTIIDGPLFDKYQFFTPGIFMGGLVGLLLLSILYVGISALTSLQVTYAAFDKEQGQLAGKKQ